MRRPRGTTTVSDELFEFVNSITLLLNEDFLPLAVLVSNLADAREINPSSAGGHTGLSRSVHTAENVDRWCVQSP